VDLGLNNTVTLRGEVNGEVVQRVMKEISALRAAKPKETIYLVLDSPGGEVQAGGVFIEFLKGQENIKTITLFAASMASGIVEANKGERLITSSGILMFHRAVIGLKGQIDGEIESELAFFKSMIEDLEKMNAERMNMSLREYREKIKDEYWIHGKQAVDKKAADKVVVIKCSNELINATSTIEFRSFFGNATIEYSKCPLFSDPVSVKMEKQGI
jgi:ATP-dependent Clp protease, protease subunit